MSIISETEPEAEPTAAQRAWNGFQRTYRWVAKLVKRLEPIQKAAAVVAALVAGSIAMVTLLGTLIKPLGAFVDSQIANRFGARGYVYYQVDLQEDGRRADYGPLFLLRPGSGTYKDIEVGDRLQAATKVNYRDWPRPTGTVMFHLYEKDCVIVLRKVWEVPLAKNKSGGWLRVATTNCGLFK